MSRWRTTAGPPPHRSWWLQEALAGEQPAPQLEVELRADVCIVGGGFTGLWTALRLKEHDPSLEVVVIEADVCGGGASGRNGGFALSLWHHFLGLELVCGSEEALRLSRASVAAVQEIGQFCAAHGIDAGYREDGWLWAATNQAQEGAWRRTVAGIERHGERAFISLTPAEVAARTGSAVHRAGVFEPTSATLQPALLARGLRRVAQEQGVRIFERSPMIALERQASLAVCTPAGRVRAERVVVAMNAWAARLRELSRAVVVVSSDVVITERARDELDRLGWRDGMSISDSRLMVNYYRTTHDGRVAFGKGGGHLSYDGRVGASRGGPSPRADWVASSLHRTFPTLGAVSVAASWTGPIDRTVDGLPFFTQLGRPDLICGLGYSGNGVGPSVIGGRVLASLALERDDEWARCGLVRAAPRGLPPEPVRYLGGRLVQSAVARKERAEDDGRAPPALAVRLARLAPTGLVPLP